MRRMKRSKIILKMMNNNSFSRRAMLKINLIEATVAIQYRYDQIDRRS